MGFGRFDEVKLLTANYLCEAIASIFQIESGALSQLLERPKSEDHGDYALPCFRWAKELKKAPPAIAGMFKDVLDQKIAADGDGALVAKVEAVGGFLNLTLQPKHYAPGLVKALIDGSYFTRLGKANLEPENVMIEYSQPNTHKAFHVGHVRNVCLGDALGRIFEYGGFKVVMANYLGDEGAHIAKCLWHVRASGEALPDSDKGKWLDAHYRAATKKLSDEKDPERLQAMNAEVSQVLAAIESKQGPIFELWQETKQWSIDDFNEIYTWFGARFDHVFYESEVSEESQEIVEEYLQKGVFKVDDGAVGLDLKDDKLGFVLLRKSDGNTLYATKDLALARRKFDQYHIDRSVYVVASEQNLHFKQVFKTLEKMGFEQASKCYHLSYGLVTLPEGKMSTRSGTTISFERLKTEVLAELDQLMERYRGEWDEAEFKDTQHKIAVAAIRFGMISSDPVKDVVFQMADWLSFEGFSGPYLVYSYARSQSLLRKAEAMGLAVKAHEGSHVDLLSTPDEVSLLRSLNDFNHAVAQVLEAYKPSMLAHQLYQMAKTYNRFLANQKVIRAPSQELALARLSLVKACAKAIEQGLGLLGILPPERM